MTGEPDAARRSGEGVSSGVACPARLSLGMFSASREPCPRNGGVGMPPLAAEAKP